MSWHTSRNWLFGILGVAIALGVLVLLRSVRESGEPREAADVTQRVQGRVEELSAAHDSILRDGNVVHTGAPQTRRAPFVASQAETLDARRSLTDAAIVSEEGPTIQAATRLPASKLRIVNGAGENAERSAADADAPKTEVAQQLSEPGNQKAEGTQHAGDKDVQKTDSVPSGDGKTDTSGNAEPVRIKANWMDWDRNSVSKGDDGNVHASPNSTLRTEVDLSSPAASIAIWAHADQTQGEWPKIRVSIDGTPMGEVTINSTEEKKFHVPIYADPGHAVVELTPIVDASDPSAEQDQSIHIRKIKVWPQTPSQ